MRIALSWIATFTVCAVIFAGATHAQQDEWYTYRYSNTRTGAQPIASSLSDPTLVSLLPKDPTWSWPPDGKAPAGPFQASPIVVNDTVFIGDNNGYFYALDAATGTLKWQYPQTSDRGLRGTCSFGQYGIQSSATHANINGQDAVIFGAPDPRGLGGARLFAFLLSPADLMNPQPIWISDIVARVSGCTSCPKNPSTLPPTSACLLEHHERIAYSSPLVLGDKVYVGLHDYGDNPIQQGRVSVVDLSTVI
jgi:hypothetical protein